MSTLHPVSQLRFQGIHLDFPNYPGIVWGNKIWYPQSFSLKICRKISHPQCPPCAHLKNLYHRLLLHLYAGLERMVNCIAWIDECRINAEVATHLRLLLRWGLLTFLQLPDVVLLIISLGLLLLSGCLGTNIGAPLAISRDSRQGEYSKCFFFFLVQTSFFILLFLQWVLKGNQKKWTKFCCYQSWPNHTKKGQTTKQIGKNVKYSTDEYFSKKK